MPREPVLLIMLKWWWLDHGCAGTRLDPSVMDPKIFAVLSSQLALLIVHTLINSKNGVFDLIQF